MSMKQSEIPLITVNILKQKKEMFAMNKFRLLVVLIFLGLFTSACASEEISAEPAKREANQGFDSVSYDAGFDADDFEGSFEDSTGELAREPSAASTNGNSHASLTQRIVIRNANLSLVVIDPAESSSQIAAMAEEMGGFVVNLNVYQTTFESGVEGESGSITIRVPAEELDESIEKIKELAIEVRYEEITGKDVTEEYTDLQSRLRHLEAIEKQLLGFLEDAGDTEDALNVFEQLERKQSEIEVIKGRIQYLEESARLSRISINLQPDFADRPLQIGSWRPVGTAKDAIEALVSTLQFIGNLIIVLFLFILPVGLVIGGIVWPLRKLYCHFRPKKEKASAEDQ
jgi:hypothetical protein